MKKMLSIIALGLLVTGCASIMTAEQAAPELNKPLSDKLAIAVVDHRPYVLNGDKEASFEGLSRSGFGIPFSRYTFNNKPMSEFLTNRLAAGLIKTGIDVSSLETTPQTKIEDVKSQDAKTVIIVLNEWKYDYHAFTDNSWYDFNVLIKNKSGEVLINKKFIGEQDVPSLTSNDIQLLYKARFEQAFKDPEIKGLL